MNFDDDITTPSTDGNIKHATSYKIDILDYDKLNNYNDVDEILPNIKTSIILLYEHAENSGHWTSIGRDINNDYWFFCSYGSDVDKPLEWVPKETREELGSGSKLLSKIFNGRKVLYNPIPFQREGTPEAVCGEFASYVAVKNNEGIPFDDILENIKEMKNKYKVKTYAEAILKYWLNDNKTTVKITN